MSAEFVVTFLEHVQLVPGMHAAGAGASFAQEYQLLLLCRDAAVALGYKRPALFVSDAAHLRGCQLHANTSEPVTGCVLNCGSHLNPN